MNRFPRATGLYCRNLMFARWLFRVLLACLVPWPILAGAWGGGVPGVEVIDTGIEVARGETDFTAIWLDERRVVFAELIDPASYEKRTANDPREHQQIVIYDVISKEKRVYAKGSFLKCVKDGRIAYSVSVPDDKNPNGYRSVPMFGEMGKEQPYTTGVVERILPDKTVKRVLSEHFLHSGDCAMRERVPEAERRGQVVRYLKREHGFIDAGNVYGKGDSDRYSTPAVLHRPDHPPVTLPFMGAYIGDTIHWSEYWKGYILQYGAPQGSPRGVTPPPSATRLLKPDGHVTEFSYPGTQTRSHVIWFRRLNWDIDHIGDSGVYVIDIETPTRVHAGLILRTPGTDMLSPDGCRVAFASRKGFRYDVPAYLMILNVCGEKK